MPTNQAIVRKSPITRLFQKTDKEFNDFIIAQHVENDELSSNVEAIRAYYKGLFADADSTGQKRIIAHEYSNLLDMLEQIKNGTMNSETFLEKIQVSTSDRKMDIVFYNVAKVFEIIFWAAAALTAYIACAAIGIPLIVAEPFTGVALTMATGLLFFKSVENGLNCFNEFASRTPAIEQGKREASLIGFFAPNAQPASTGSSPVVDDMEDMDDMDVQFPGYPALNNRDASQSI